jgi:uncharacterized protein (DUF2062 family)
MRFSDFYKKYTLTREQIESHPHLKRLVKYMVHPNHWQINAQSLPRAMAVGLFIMFMPLPAQTLLAAIAAIIFRANLLVAIPLVWISNPITIAPMFYGAYLLGKWLLGIDGIESQHAHTLDYLWAHFHLIWQPFLLGCAVAGAACAVLGYALAKLFCRVIHKG